MNCFIVKLPRVKSSEFPAGTAPCPQQALSSEAGRFHENYLNLHKKNNLNKKRVSGINALDAKLYIF
jgi:hypothetical protein